MPSEAATKPRLRLPPLSRTRFRWSAGVLAFLACTVGGQAPGYSLQAFGPPQASIHQPWLTLVHFGNLCAVRLSVNDDGSIDLLLPAGRRPNCEPGCRNENERRHLASSGPGIIDWWAAEELLWKSRLDPNVSILLVMVEDHAAFEVVLDAIVVGTSLGFDVIVETGAPFWDEDPDPGE